MNVSTGAVCYQQHKGVYNKNWLCDVFIDNKLIVWCIHWQQHDCVMYLLTIQWFSHVCIDNNMIVWSMYWQQHDCVMYVLTTTWLCYQCIDQKKQRPTGLTSISSPPAHRARSQTDMLTEWVPQTVKAECSVSDLSPLYIHMYVCVQIVQHSHGVCSLKVLKERPRN